MTPLLDFLKTQRMQLIRSHSADFIIAIKNDFIMDLYFLRKEKFINLLKEVVSKPDLFLTVVNRWEGNSIRVNKVKY